MSKFEIKMVESPHVTLAARTFSMFGYDLAEVVPVELTSPGDGPTPFIIAGYTVQPTYAQLAVEVFGTVYVASQQPVTITSGTSENSQVVCSWWDVWARPRAIRGAEGVKIGIRASTSGPVTVWAAKEIETL